MNAARARRYGNRIRRSVRISALALAIASLSAFAQETVPSASDLPITESTPAVDAPAETSSNDDLTRSGADIYRSFRAGLADAQCDAEASGGRWRAQFAHAPGQLVRADSDLLPLFGYVVDALREAELPTEFALIPFVESGYRPGARNRNGPSGLWQFIGQTARNHGVTMRGDYDGRLSPIDSTQAAIRYLKTLHGMFGGDWRLTVMAYNAGEYRILQSMRRAGVNSTNAEPASLPGLSPVTYAYVQKLHALACIFETADDHDDWLEQLEHPVPRLAVHELPRSTRTLDQWAALHGHDGNWLKRLNPGLSGTMPRLDRPTRVLAPAFVMSSAGESENNEADAIADSSSSATPPIASVSAAPAKRIAASTQSHRVRSGESAWTIARRYGIRPQQLLSRNGLKADAILKPGMVLKIDKPR